MDASIATLLGESSLPFVGREAVLSRIVEFWKELFTSSRLRTLLIVGESGVGKSSLIGRAAEMVESEGGTTIRINLFPNAPGTLARLIAQSLWLAPESRALLEEEPQGTIPSVAAALRRIIRLRPTLLIIDSLHLLDRDEIGELSALTYALAEEPLAMLATQRPVTTDATAVLEEFLAERMLLKGLTRSEIAELCAKLLKAPVSDEIAGALHGASYGNPQALRLALRGATTSGTIGLSRPSNTWVLQSTSSEFLKRLALDAAKLTAGMIVQLTDQERRAASALACLGEIFSEEAAQVILGDDRCMLAALQAKGIVIEAEIAHPLPGSTLRGRPLTFAHSLLHPSFLAASTLDPARLVSVITADHPIYSIYPYRLMAEAEQLSITPDDLAHLIDHAITTAGEIDHSPLWQTAGDLCRITVKILERYGDLLSPERHRRLHLRLLAKQSYVLRRDKAKQEFRQTVTTLRAITEDPRNEETAYARVMGLAHYLDGFDRSPTILPINHEIVAEIDALIEKFPALRPSHAYIYYLASMTRVATTLNDEKTLRRVANLFDAAMKEPSEDESLHTAMLGTIGPRILAAFETRAELDERMKLLRRLEQSEAVTGTTFPRLKTVFLINTLHHKEALAEIEKIVRDLVRLNLRGMWGQWQVGRIELLHSYGKSLEESQREIDAIRASAPRESIEQLHIYAAHALAVLGTVSARFDWTLKLIEERIPTFLGDFAFQTVATLANRGRTIPPESDLQLHPETAALFRLIAGETDVETAEFIEEMRILPTKGLLREGDLTYLQILIGLIDLAVEKNPAAKPLRDLVAPYIGAAIVQALKRLEEDQIFAWMRLLLDHGARYLSTREIKRWRARIAELEISWTQEHPLPQDEQIVDVSMFGAIEIRRTGEEPKQVRGARLRMLLGLMVANQALDRPLSLQEFCAITEGDLDLERAKNNLHVGIHRLREALGHNAIITEQGVPRLNPDLVGVDLIDARRLLEEALTALRKGHLVRAWSALSRALAITRGATPYPTLYNDFFEASRLDFELYLRQTTIAVAQAFLVEEDPASAAKVLRLAAASMPGDEEITELLAQALIRSGRRAEAERLKLRVEPDDPSPK